MNMRIAALFLAVLLMSSTAFAGVYNLDIARQEINIDGKSFNKITVNGGIPGPTLHFTEGEDVTVNVTNHMDEDTSIHWHGLLIPPAMDGVPDLNGFEGIKPNTTFTYHFKIRQAGTYWYHSHSGAQEQDGNYGSIVITPKGKDPIKADRDYVVLLSDLSPEKPSSILGNLKMDSSYYNHAERTIGDFFGDVKKLGFNNAWKNAKDWGKMRMSPTDLADVSGYTFLMNGKSSKQNWTGIFKKGEKVRLRFINASAMSFYDVRIPDLKMMVVAADGQNVEPVPIDEFRFGIAETYDVIVEPTEDKAYTIVAEPIDRSGFALGTLAPKEGMQGALPKQRPRTTLTMADMNMDMMMKDDPNMDMSNMAMESGWAKTGIPAGQKELGYKDLRYLGTQKDLRSPEREIVVTLGGNMERYIWTMDGKVYDGMSPINLRYGERVRLKFINETMMAHPMHLHGMFVQLENGQPAGKLPNKHTVIVPPGQSYSVLLTADEVGEWAFHCHLLYHMLSGMMNKVVVAKLDAKDMPVSKQPDTPKMNKAMPEIDHSKMGHDMKSTGGQHHAH
jgi:FtsP/CotA-like multicopper oxidase with cupredoxin domain